MLHDTNKAPKKNDGNIMWNKMESVKGYTSDHNIVTFAHCYSAIKRFQMTQQHYTERESETVEC